MKYKSSLMKSPHEIKLEELQKWLLNSKLMYASSSMENKQLFRDMNGCFELHHGGEIVWRGIQAYSAVEKYNNITEYKKTEK